MISFPSVLSIIYWFFRPLVKWFLRKTTRLCELQRICYGKISGAPRTLAVEYSLKNSKNVLLQKLIYFKEESQLPHKKALHVAIETVINSKKINPQVHVQFVKSFGKCMEQIWCYISFCKSIEKLRKQSYNCTNDSHEEMLLLLWDSLMPDVKLESRVTKQWQLIGFQGDDPKTDFRGMGILALENLLFFATEYASSAHRILMKSQHPRQGYAFAVVGINLTHLAYHLVRDGAAKTHMYNRCNMTGSLSLRTFHQFYSNLFIEFDDFWTKSKPKNIMDFSFIRDKFENNIRERLRNFSPVFTTNIVIGQV